MSGGGEEPVAAPVPRVGIHWQLGWKLGLPALHGPVDALLRIRADNGAAAVARVLCTGCARRASGSIVLTGSEALRLVRSDATVVVRSRSTTLRGVVKVLSGAPAAPAG